MKNILRVTILLWINGAGLLMADAESDLFEYSKDVFKGGKVYADGEIESIAEREDWNQHHRVILQVQMLASADDSKRFKRAIDLASNYIDSGEIEWVRSYLRMQRGFLYNLTGERGAGNTDLEALVNDNYLNEVGTIQDPILESMRIRQKNLSIYFGDVMRQSIGHHYLDFRKDGMLPERAYYYFNSIESNGLRKECLNQLKLRVGDKYDAVRKKAEEIQNFSSHSENSNDLDERTVVREPRRSNRQSKNDLTDHSRVSHSKDRSLTATGVIMLFILTAILAVYVVRRTIRSPG